MHKIPFFRDGRFEMADCPTDMEDSIEDQLQSAGYSRLCSFGPQGGQGFGFTIDRNKDGERHVVTMDYGHTWDMIFIESFADYMYFLRDFGHLGTLADTSEMAVHLKEARGTSLRPAKGLRRTG